MSTTNQHTFRIDSAYDEKGAEIVEKAASLGQLGSLDGAISKGFLGLNHRQAHSALPKNRNIYGLTFFTRPALNLSTPNISRDRLFTPLITSFNVEGNNLINDYIRCMLDPVFCDNERKTSNGLRECKNPIVDPYTAFIPLLTNTLTDMSGFRDVTTHTYDAPQGSYKETFGFVDGPSKDFTSYDIQASFRNVLGDPINKLFYYWCHYMALVYDGTFSPYIEFWKNFEIDYNTRIYRITLDATKTYVQDIFATGASFPTSAQIGNIGNFDSKTPINANSDTISISFRSYGSIYNDPILVYEFNKVVEIFNESMKDEHRDSRMKKLKTKELMFFNHQGYPRINPDTYELEWYIRKQYYEESMKILKRDISFRSSASAANKSSERSDRDRSVQIPEQVLNPIGDGKAIPSYSGQNSEGYDEEFVDYGVDDGLE